MSILHRRRAVYARTKQAEAMTIPPWAELSKLDAEGARILAGKLDIEYTTRGKTLSAINKAGK